MWYWIISALVSLAPVMLEDAPKKEEKNNDTTVRSSCIQCVGHDWNGGKNDE